VLVFLGATVCLWLASVRTTQIDVLVGKTLALVLVSATAVCVPAFLVTLWALVEIHVLSLGAVKHISYEQLTAAAGVVSVAIAWLAYRRDAARHSASVRDDSHRIVLPGER
jgi:hypothetical protein